MRFLISFTVCMVLFSTLSHAQICLGVPGRMTLTATNMTDSIGSVNLTWTHSGATGKGWSSWYNLISYKLSSASVYSFSNTPILRGLIPGQRYDFRVTSTRICLGDSAEQAVTASVSSFQLKPATPFATRATNVTNISITANWMSSGIADHYYVDISTDSVFNSQTIVWSNLDAGSNKFMNILGFVGGTMYFYRVRAVNDAGVSDYSNVSGFLTSVSPASDLIPTIGVNQFTAKWKVYGSFQKCFIEVHEIKQTPTGPYDTIYYKMDTHLQAPTDNNGISASFLVTTAPPASASSPSLFFYKIIVTDGASTSEVSSSSFLVSNGGTLSPQIISVSPNPSTGLFHIGLPSAERSQCFVFDQQGNLVHQSKHSLPTLELDLRHVQKGTYILQLQQGKENYQYRILIH